MMRAPGFWANSPARPGWQARLLAPAAALWRLAAAGRAAATRPEPAPVPVICIGNLTAGGAGKTPVVAWLVEQLLQAGQHPHVLSRGHGGRLSGPHRVEPATDTHRDVGDEPLMLAALAPVWIARDRVAGARAAVAAGASVIVMDDGFQNPSLHKDLSLVVVDAGQGLGNQRVIPAGPLREPAPAGLARADALVLIGDSAARGRALERWPALAGRPLHHAALRPRMTGLDLKGEPVVAFAGIGRPEKFFDTLRGIGARLVVAEAFPDHHDYAPRVLDRLLRLARGRGAMLVTTEKDAVRLSPDIRREVVTLQVILEPAEPQRLAALALQAANRSGEAAVGR